MARFVPPITHLAKSDFSGSGSGWLLNFYSTGTTTRKDTFSDSALTVANANPVVADSSGRFGDIFLESGTYKVVLTDENAVEIWTADPVDGAGSATGAVDEKTVSYTVTLADNTKTLAVDASGGAVTITLLAAATAGDGFKVGVKKTDSSANAVTVDGNGAETVDGSASVNLVAEGDNLEFLCDGTNWQIVGFNAVASHTYSGISTLLSQARWAKGADVASAGALTLGTDGNYYDITGTTAITSIGTLGVGTNVCLHFDAALTLTHHATDLILPGAANITTAAGDEAEFVEYAAGDWRCVSYTKASGFPVVIGVGSDAQGDILYRGASIYERLAAGTSGQVLATQGAAADPQWVSAGRWLELAEGTASGSSLDIFFTPADSRVLKIFLTDFKPVSGTVSFLIRTSTNASTFDSSSGDYEYAHLMADGSTVTGETDAGTATSIVFPISQTTGAGGMNAEVTLFRPVGTEFTHIQTQLTVQDSGGGARTVYGGGYRTAAADVDGIQFLYVGVNATGTYKVLGLLE